MADFALAEDLEEWGIGGFTGGAVGGVSGAGVTMFGGIVGLVTETETPGGRRGPAPLDSYPENYLHGTSESACSFVTFQIAGKN